ncbi:uncharacterized protein DUF4331 [Limnobacter thiooxidans]|uniref:DUF4331 domain-containing protein n=1 Tax=Limnobacter TaxID=131079 RepID=UPI00102D8B7F|nr:DUF4331 domain-containing protein [Limnobacter sp.]MCZ8016656.1 DUF4331 domain-containing protein [Limnobacter sp.]RZS38463.1 uncharacterized protein DUF4331 [Limnobacter thiooxidans]
MLKVQRKTAVQKNKNNFKTKILLGGVLSAISIAALASSHREAPSITTTPKADGTDFYMFRSYEANRSDFITLIANYQPLQDGYGGPNYFSMDPNALYEIHIDNDGDAQEEITFQFNFKNTLRDLKQTIGGADVSIPLIQQGGVTGLNSANLNLNESYTMTVVRDGRRSGNRTVVSKTGGGSTLEKPVDYIGEKTLGNAAAYQAYSDAHIHNVTIPGCTGGTNQAKVFVGQRQEGFAVNLGTIFDLVNAPFNVISNRTFANAAAANSIQDKNVTSIAIEIHKDCLTPGAENVVGGWTTASVRQVQIGDGIPAQGHQTAEKTGGAWVQVSRLGMPLVNEVVIGLKDKDRFNASKPSGDGQFLNYVSNPTLPQLISLVQTGNAGAAPTNFPRTDLLNVFLAGIQGVNRPANVVLSEMLRLNTETPVTPIAMQNTLGLAFGDAAGFPNGRRPIDDVVDISLVAVMGGLCVANGANDAFKLNTVPGTTLTSACTPGSVPLGNTSLSIHDAVDQSRVPFMNRFPYLSTPTPGSGTPAPTQTVLAR